mgnify:CR=1 FL=1
MSMQSEIIYGNWIIIDGAYGVSVYPGEYFTIDDAIVDYGGRVYEIDSTLGYCARLTMPGFLDSTEWIGPYDSEREAMRDIETMFDLEGVFLSENDSRETSPEILSAIWNVAKYIDPVNVYATADEIWQSPGDFLASIVDKVTDNHQNPAEDYCWGASGHKWAEG